MWKGRNRTVYCAFLLAFGERIISALTFLSRLYSATHRSNVRSLIFSTRTVRSIQSAASPDQK